VKSPWLRSNYLVQSTRNTPHPSGYLNLEASEHFPYSGVSFISRLFLPKTVEIISLEELTVPILLDINDLAALRFEFQADRL
jgi:hypothetical protein